MRTPSPPAASRFLRGFLATEAAGGVLLLAAALGAIVWVNVGGAASYNAVWGGGIDVRVGGLALPHDLRHLVNEGLMTLFFLVAGLEIRRELVTGELRQWRQASLPVLAALGGMIVPALIFTAINAGAPGIRGWGIPMATDIAFALGVLALMAKRVPPGLALFLLTLAVVDDVGAIVVIAVFYSASIAVAPLAVAFVLVVTMVGLRRLRVGWTPAYVVLGVGVWLAVLQSGVHATIAGVVLALVAPAPDRLERRLHPVSSFVIVPLFALANAGVALDVGALRGNGPGRVALGVVVALVVGKVVGVLAGASVAVRLGIGALPRGVDWRHLTGAAALAGIGFTVSLFITDLAFTDPALRAASKLAILAASVLASALGASLLLGGSTRRYNGWIRPKS